MAKLLTALKDNNQDYEYYPTKKSMLEIIKKHSVAYFAQEDFKVLEVGAGNADAGIFLAGEAGEIHTIEKSPILTTRQPTRCIPIGIDFSTLTLLDKDHYDFIFCNPPYKVSGGFVEWMEKIIREASAGVLYFVVPERWEKNESIQLAIREREAGYEVLGSDDFLDGERSARAKVDIVVINLRANYGRCRVNAFDKWLQKEFGAAKEDEVKTETHTRGEELVNNGSFAEALVENYNGELTKLTSLYKALSGFTVSDLESLGLTEGKVTATLKEKIAGLKKDYWGRLFGRYSKINKRLSSWSRRDLVYKLSGIRPRLPGGGVQQGAYEDDQKGRLNVDFTLDNIHMITGWVCRQSNEYFDAQAVRVYETVLTHANTVNFKSNKRVFEKENFRWQAWEGKITHVALKPDLRFILSGKGECSDKVNWDNPNGAHKTTNEFLNDLRAVAYNLGFVCEESSFDKTFAPGKNTEFNYPDGGIFMLAKPHLSRTLHVKMDSNFLKAWTILVSRLTGWVKSPEEFKKEAPAAYTTADVNKYWGKEKNYRITSEGETKLISEW